ncbi:hypothetical protein A8709_27445 [Paenibacillus pectinilyticus]|uniref:Phospholipase/carboxylesterase/thioesterase domain-containing protein n=1 Tax=Paenibacillus pectinilyticus TaxID=512399 RepID=A0A1C1A9H8_9BACL|nr:PHB depolymerase family esterase [Paenibacillus pectinilyticus]OCT17265.1 hypothetical protein A8709_27445 [Paenibacillus pectinilyticus]
MPVTSHRFCQDIPPNSSLNYQLFVPHDFELKSEQQYPLFVFLHGIKKRGDDISVLNKYGLTWIAESKPDFPFIVVTPQCPADSNWTHVYQSVIALINEITTSYPVDTERMYLTGFSMGGNGTWDIAARSPELFSAIVPISGWYEPEKANLLKDVRIWAFHCVDDDVVRVSGTEEMVEAITNIGGNIKATYYSELGHSHTVMEKTFNNQELYDWLLN